MLDTAKREGFALPAVIVSTVTAINGALQALAEAKSDRILKEIPCAAAFAAGDTDTPAQGFPATCR